MPSTTEPTTIDTTTRSPVRRTVALVAVALAAALVGGAVGTAWAAQTFPDVPPDHTFFKEVEWGAKHNIINGFTDGTFRPGQPVTRGQAAAFLSHYNDAIHTVTSIQDPPLNSVFVSVAVCPIGYRPVGGVGHTTSSKLVITDTYLVNREFQVRWATIDGTNVDPLQIRVTALCLPGTAGTGTSGTTDALPTKSDG